ncbi:alpha-1,2 glucosyltransferase alg10 protein [Rutstroemia sp. NJR-2017a WRK4]|nr:alpha-1,2 glucosyltransferase alg10 protein [Rutstroemia sp. NJR-2017a WRK4]
MSTFIFGLVSLGALALIEKASILNLGGLDKRISIVACLGVYLLASFWEHQVTKIVPSPYLDEVFHIPQAQAYCRGDWLVWDPKLTTPPGLYVLTTLFAKLHLAACNVHILRFFNTVTLLLTLSYACDCRNLIVSGHDQKNAFKSSKDAAKRPKATSIDTLHTALNIALFPPLFFFSGLYYTDILSTCMVLKIYKTFLEGRGGKSRSNFQIYLWGMVSLTMRQTNIFWAAIFIGGMEVVRTLQNPLPSTSVHEREKLQSLQSFVQARWNEALHGMVFDVPLRSASLEDIILTPLTLIPALLVRLPLILRNLLPYLSLLTTFTTLIYINGGVVLGDKENHIATIHLPQVLYIWPFISFFSFPLLLPSLFFLLRTALYLPSTLLKYTKNPTPRPVILTLLSGSALLVVLAVVKFNTIIHPFTLADNRHYIFYVFRYTILRHPLIRYLLAPIYLLCFWLVYNTLAGANAANTTPSSFPSSTPPSNSKPNLSKSSTKPKTQETKAQFHASPTEHKDPSPTSSFLLIYILTTALSLITAPLVEPRYFILPWVFLRLHLPTPDFPNKLVLNSNSSAPTEKQKATRINIYLLMETAHHLLINLVTGYIFLYRGFSWPQEEGKVQRFMW